MQNITKQFPGVLALDRVSFSLQKGEIHGLVGENGAGKSTLMKIMSGSVLKDHGDIFLDGENIEINSVKTAKNLGISIIYQELNLCKDLSVADNIFMGKFHKKGPFIDTKKMHQEARQILNDLGCDLDTHEIVGNLSISKQQMVEIAKALSNDLKILILDEPTATLTDSETEKLFTTMNKLKKQGVSMVYISHRLEEVEKICDRITVLRDGNTVGEMLTKDVNMNQVISMMVGRDFKDKFPKYERKNAEILGIFGLVGSGRTRMARSIFEADKKGEIGYVTENRKHDGLALSLSIDFNVNMANLKNISKFGFVSDKKSKKIAENYINLLKIKTPSTKEICKNLSGGNQQKVVLAKWLSRDLKTLIVDEPTRGIDIGAKYEIYELFNKLSDSGLKIIMISSDISEILGMSDKIIVMKNGEASRELITKDTSKEELMKMAMETGG
ncbi:MAG: sugar ABC transporter ATP-binding protein [Defluviitaleaceae bacterium]|nr:sugar ABC transporter ATP-binding protein [Defluviitaleaceae bacterium]